MKIIKEGNKILKLKYKLKNLIEDFNTCFRQVKLAISKLNFKNVIF